MTEPDPKGRKPIYTVRLPWLGPRMGPLPGAENARVPISAAVHPVHQPLYAALVQVVDANEGHWAAAEIKLRELKKSDADDENDALEPGQIDQNGGFRLEVERTMWSGSGVRGVLVVLLYDASPDLDQGAYPLDPMPLARIAIETFLAENQKSDLEIGLLELAAAATALRASSASTATEVTFALASCQYPWGLLDESVALSSYRRLGRRLRSKTGDGKPQFLLLVGDQVYVDATAGLFDPTAQFDRFVSPYEKLFRAHAVKDVLRRLPAYAMMDDHEIEDNWEPIAWQPESLKIMRVGRRSYWAFQRSAGPARRAKGDDSPWYTFSEHGFPFFVADTRTEREPRTAAAIEQAAIMSEMQFGEMERWLSAQDKQIPKFIVSPAILLPRRLKAREHVTAALRSDSWDGYPRSLHRLLGYIADKEIKNVVFLSGDDHLACVAEATITNRQNQCASILSIHSPALYAPFPFANTARADLAARETFKFSPDPPASPPSEPTHLCEVSTEFPASGDGFVVIRVSRDGCGWKISCELDLEPGRAAADGRRRIDRRLARC